MMKKIGIAVDDWKLPVFRRRLRKAGFEYEDEGPITGNTTLLRVTTDRVDELSEVVSRAQDECARRHT